MTSVIDSLRPLVQADPLPEAHTSSHWTLHGAQTQGEFQGDGVRLQASGFDVIARPRWGGRLLHLAEWWSYRAARRGWASFPSVWASALRLVRELGGGPDFSTWKSAAVLATLTDHWAAEGLAPRTAVMIGDGSGFLGALLRRVAPEVRLYCVDLPKILIFQARMHEQADPRARLSLLWTPGWAEADVVLVPPQDMEQIPGPIDCAVNIASMQEMTAVSIAGYFAFLRRRSSPASRFYCVNREEKALPGGEVTRFADYPWRVDDEVFLDGPCPYYRHYFSPKTHPSGPRVLGWRVPYVNHFEGRVWHCLARLAPEACG